MANNYSYLRNFWYVHCLCLCGANACHVEVKDILQLAGEGVEASCSGVATDEGVGEEHGHKAKLEEAAENLSREGDVKGVRVRVCLHACTCKYAFYC